MQITDAPYAAGTPEHNEWVRDVLIPYQQNQVQLADMVAGRENRLGSAESQGRAVIQGGPWDRFVQDVQARLADLERRSHGPLRGIHGRS